MDKTIGMEKKTSLFKRPNNVAITLPDSIIEYQIEIIYTGEDADQYRDFYHVLAALVPAIRLNNKVSKVKVSDDEILYKSRRQKPCTDVVIFVESGMPQTGSKQAAWINQFIDLLQKQCQLTTLKNIQFNLKVRLTTVQSMDNRGKAFNETELINQFLDDELEFTYKDTPQDVLTIKGVLAHLYHCWLSDAHDRGISTFCLNDQKSVERRLRYIVVDRQPSPSDETRARVSIGRRRKGLSNFLREAHDPSTDCFIGVRYKRTLYHECSGDKFKNYVDIMSKSVVEAAKMSSSQEPPPAKRSKVDHE